MNDELTKYFLANAFETQRQRQQRWVLTKPLGWREPIRSFHFIICFHDENLNVTYCESKTVVKWALRRKVRVDNVSCSCHCGNANTWIFRVLTQPLSADGQMAYSKLFQSLWLTWPWYVWVMAQSQQLLTPTLVPSWIQALNLGFRGILFRFHLSPEDLQKVPANNIVT